MMKAIRAALLRLTGLVRRDRRDRELSDEIESHLQLHIDDAVRSGMSPADARRTALVKLGGVEATKEAYRDRQSVPFIETTLQDLRLGLRILIKQKGFTITAVALLAVGIGANSAVFSVVNAMLLKPRVGHPDGLVVGLYSQDRTQPANYRAFSYPNYADLRSHTDVFASLTAHNFALVGVADHDVTRRVLADVATANYFDTFSAPLALGRTFRGEEERPGAHIPVVIIGYQTWQRLGGRPDVLGQTLQVNTRAYTIIGATQQGFGGSLVLASPELWLPIGMYDTLENDWAQEGQTANFSDRAQPSLIVVARLHPGATIASVAPAVDALGRQLEQAFPSENRNQALSLAPLSRMSVGPTPHTDAALEGMTIAFFSMSCLVLIIASVNLANMLLARGGARRKEMAIRLAIGGSRGRIVRQLLTEGLLLSLLGGAAGLLLASWSTHSLTAAIGALAPVSIWLDPTPDARIFSATLAFAMLSTLVFGLVPAWRLARTDAVPELKDQSGEILRGRRTTWALPNLLVTAQLACSLVLLTVAAIFIRSANETAHANPGFSFDRGIVAQIDAGLAGYTPVKAREVYADALARMRARPDVTAASFASMIPFGDFEDSRSVQKAGASIATNDPRAATELVESNFASIGRDYFNAVGLSMIRGRDFSTAEETSPDAPRVAIVDQPLANKLFGDQAPIGRDVLYGAERPGEHVVVMHVIGLAPGLREELFDTAPVPHLYVPLGREFRTGVYVHIRTSSPSAQTEAALVPSLRHALADVDPSLPIIAVQTGAAYRDGNAVIAIVRLGAIIFCLFGAIALLLATLGVYGLKAYLVSRHRREIGIRLALGATPRGIVMMIARDGLTSSVVGLILGVVLSLVAGLGMRSLSYQNRGADPLVVGSALVVLAAAGALASWLSSRAAARIAPTTIMRDS